MYCITSPRDWKNSFPDYLKSMRLQNSVWVHNLLGTVINRQCSRTFEQFQTIVGVLQGILDNLKLNWINLYQFEQSYNCNFTTIESFVLDHCQPVINAIWSKSNTRLMHSISISKTLVQIVCLSKQHLRFVSTHILWLNPLPLITPPLFVNPGPEDRGNFWGAYKENR